MNAESITILSTVTAGIGAGIAFFIKNGMNGKEQKFTKGAHDEICKAKMDYIEKRFDTGESQFRELRNAIEITRESIIERIDNIILKG